MTAFPLAPKVVIYVSAVKHTASVAALHACHRRRVIGFWVGLGSSHSEMGVAKRSAKFIHPNFYVLWVWTALNRITVRYLSETVMPAYVALDELMAAMRHIAASAELGLEIPAMRFHALLAIQRCCAEVDDAVRGIFGGAADELFGGSIH